MDISEKYQQANTLIKKYYYEEAKELLKVISSKVENPHVYWLLGLVEAQLGNLHEALVYLKKVDVATIPEAESLMEAIKQKLPKYESICSSYNYALTLLQQGKNKKALIILEGIVSHRSTIPLAIPIYKTYLITLANNDKKLCLEKAKELPTFVLNAKEIQSIEFLFDTPTQALLIEETRRAKAERRKNFFPLKTSHILIAIIVVLMTFYTVHTVLNTASTKKEVSYEQSVKVEANQEDIQGEIIEEKDEETNLEEPLKVISDSEADAYYSKGRKSYEAGKYKEAIIYFENVLLGENIQYFTDDAHYYLIMCLRTENMHEEAINEAKKFENETDQAYINSNFKNAVSLIIARCYLDLNKEEEAIAQLDKMKDLPEDWAVRAAKELLSNL